MCMCGCGCVCVCMCVCVCVGGWVGACVYMRSLCFTFNSSPTTFTGCNLDTVYHNTVSGVYTAVVHPLCFLADTNLFKPPDSL